MKYLKPSDLTEPGYYHRWDWYPGIKQWRYIGVERVYRVGRSLRVFGRNICGQKGVLYRKAPMPPAPTEAYDGS